jgi:hypothetical protein
MKTKGVVQTPTDRSNKSHVQSPPRELGPSRQQQAATRHGTGQFTGAGRPPLEKR